jgi:DNA repair photolyase
MSHGKLKVVEVPPIRTPLRKSPGFAKKLLSDYALDLLALCGYGCRYCSSNNGNYLRIHRGEFAELARQQLGYSLTPEMDPQLTYVWPDVIARLEQQLVGRRPGFGLGRTVVFSMLTDGFSPHLVADGTTRRALELVLEKTQFKIRILTKNACVGSRAWTAFFAAHPGRFVVGLSLGTLDDGFAKHVEIGTSPPSARARAYAKLRDAGIPTYGMLCPIFPDALRGSGVEDLLEVVQPEQCERVWAEPFNDRANWRHVKAGFPAAGPTSSLLEEIYGRGRTELWSRYAAGLYFRLRSAAESTGWIDRLTYLLYEDLIRPEDVPELRDLRGVLLQSKPGEDGLSTNPHIAELERVCSSSGVRPRAHQEASR